MADEQSGTLLRIVEHAPDVRSLIVRPARPFSFLPGQFISCRLPIDGATLTRAYSIASDPEHPDELELVLDLVPGGPGSSYLFGLTPGATLTFSGPWGTFVLAEPPEVETVFIADGTAIAPIRPMLHRACDGGAVPLHLLYGLSPRDPRLYAAELDALAAAHPRFEWTPAPSAELEHRVHARWVDADTDRFRHFFVCAVGERALRIKRLLRGAGYDRRAVLYERW